MRPFQIICALSLLSLLFPLGALSQSFSSYIPEDTIIVEHGDAGFESSLYIGDKLITKSLRLYPKYEILPDYTTFDQGTIISGMSTFYIRNATGWDVWPDVQQSITNILEETIIQDIQNSFIENNSETIINQIEETIVQNFQTDIYQAVHNEIINNSTTIVNMLGDTIINNVTQVITETVQQDIYENTFNYIIENVTEIVNNFYEEITNISRTEVNNFFTNNAQETHGIVLDDTLIGALDGVNSTFRTHYPYIPGQIAVYWDMDYGGATKMDRGQWFVEIADPDGQYFTIGLRHVPPVVDRYGIPRTNKITADYVTSATSVTTIEGGIVFIPPSDLPTPTPAIIKAGTGIIVTKPDDFTVEISIDFTPTPTATITPTVTPTPTVTTTPTNSPTATSTPTPTRTATPTFTSTATPTRTNTPTATVTPTQTPTVAFISLNPTRLGINQATPGIVAFDPLYSGGSDDDSIATSGGVDKGNLALDYSLYCIDNNLRYFLYAVRDYAGLSNQDAGFYWNGQGTSGLDALGMYSFHDLQFHADSDQSGHGDMLFKVNNTDLLQLNQDGVRLGSGDGEIIGNSNGADINKLNVNNEFQIPTDINGDTRKIRWNDTTDKLEIYDDGIWKAIN